MLKYYDDNDNIMVESEHNAAMISAYLRNLARFLDSDILDQEYGMLCRCADFLWIIKKDLREE